MGRCSRELSRVLEDRSFCWVGCLALGLPCPCLFLLMAQADLPQLPPPTEFLPPYPVLVSLGLQRKLPVLTTTHRVAEAICCPHRVPRGNIRCELLGFLLLCGGPLPSSHGAVSVPTREGGGGLWSR